MRNSLLSLLFVGLAACTVEAPDSSGSGEDRGSLGKADIVGSCEHKGYALCGGRGKGNCWCDDACVEYGDCCADVEEVCGIEPPPPEGEPCGGFAGLPCDEGEFCSFTEEQTCGFADQMGECVEIPEGCNKMLAPVCGCDGNTHPNSCFAAKEGVSIAHQGECEVEVDTCGPIEQDFENAVAAIRSCETDDECGQVLAGTSCGCTRNWVARIDADLADYEEIRAKLEANACSLPGGISTCDCPAADGFACEAGICTWNYTQG